VVIEAALAREPSREIVILDDSPDASGRSILGIAVTGGREVLQSLGGSPVMPAIGDNRGRISLIDWLREQGYALATVVHPSALIGASVVLGAGVFVSAGAIVIAQARLGDGAIVNTGASVDHDCVVGQAAHIGPGVHLCGSVHVGPRTLVGVGSCARPGISICDDVVIGAGSVVVADINEAGTYAGNPARRLR
jgi:sugar O-acyltransferase (sialic acid O-acetyltransferase NeuD family)